MLQIKEVNSLSSYRNRNCDHDCDCDFCCPQRRRTTITLVATTPTVCTLNTGNNSTVLSGQVLVNGRPADGVIVEFSVTPNLGNVIPLATITTSSGNFTAVFLSNNGPGMVTVTATVPECDGATTSIPISITPCS